MRSRATAIFVLLVVVLAATGYLVRTLAVERSVRAHDDVLLRRGAATIALVADRRARTHQGVDATLMHRFVGEGLGVRFHPVNGSNVDVRGPGFDGSLEPSDANPNLWAVAELEGGGYVLLGEDDDTVRSIALQSLPAMLLLLLVTALVATLAGVLLGRWYERPFSRLAEAAAALGRGRFQLDLPQTRVPAANEIARALDVSARRLQDRLAAEDEFAQRVSHALRSPLTGLRLELEEVALHDGLPAESAAVLERSLQRVDQIDAVTGELVALARHRAMVAEATIALEVLARQVGQRWADELDAQHRTLTTAVQGDGATTYTPGPVEQILELLLVDVLHRSSGSVRLVFAAGDADHLRITVTAGPAATGRAGESPPRVRARTIALALGGRLEGEYAAGGVEIVLPRR